MRAKIHLMSHLWLDETGKIIREETDVASPYTLTPNETKLIIHVLNQRDFSKHINPDDPKPVKIFVPIDIFHKKTARQCRYHTTTSPVLCRKQKQV